MKDDEGKPIFVEASQVAQYMDETFWEALNIYAATELLGTLPFSGGWAEQPALVVQAIMALKVEQRLIESEKRNSDD